MRGQGSRLLLGGWMPVELPSRENGSGLLKHRRPSRPRDEAASEWNNEAGSCRGAPVFPSGAATRAIVKICFALLPAAGLHFVAAFNRHRRRVAGGPDVTSRNAELVGDDLFDLGPLLLKADAHGGRRQTVLCRQATLCEALALQSRHDVGIVPTKGGFLRTARRHRTPRVYSLANANAEYGRWSTGLFAISANSFAIESRSGRRTACNDAAR
jgi:hypothetical protein